MSKISSLFLYLGVYTVSAFLLMLSKKEKGKKIDLLFVLSIILPVLLAAFRDEVGTDYENYSWMFQSHRNLTFSNWYRYTGKFIDGTPIGMWAVSRIANFFDSQEMYFGLLAGLVLAPGFLFIKNKVHPKACFLVAFMFLTGTFTTGLNITKQSIAIAFIVYGMRYVFERKLIKYLTCVLLAYCFHPSAVVALLIYFFWKSEGMKTSGKRLLLISLSVIFVFSFSFVLERLGGRFAGYTEDVSVEFNNRTFYLNLAWLAIMFLFKKNYERIGWNNDLLLNLFLVGCIMTATGFVSPYVKRIASYYTFPKNFLIAQVPLLFEKNVESIIKIIIFVYAIFMFTYSFYILEHSGIIPYKFIGGSVI